MKRFVKASICSLMAMSLMFNTVTASAEVQSYEGMVTYEALREIVKRKVDTLDFDNSSLDGVIEGINKVISETVTGIMMGMMNAETINSLITPLLSEVIEQVLGSIGVELPESMDINELIAGVVSSIITEDLMSNEFISEILNRTVKYAVEAIMGEVQLPSPGDIEEGHREALTTELTDKIFGTGYVKVSPHNTSPLVKGPFALGISKRLNVGNSSYYAFDITTWEECTIKIIVDVKTECAKEINITGWNERQIGTFIDLNSFFDGLGGVEMPSLDEIKFEDHLVNAFLRAAQEVITESIEGIVSDVKEAIIKVIDDLKQQIEDALLPPVTKAKTEIARAVNMVFADAKVNIVLNPTDSFKVMEQKIIAGLGNLDENQYKIVVLALEQVKKIEEIKTDKTAVLFIDLFIFGIELKYEDGKLDGVKEQIRDYIYTEVNAILAELQLKVEIKVTDTVEEITAKLTQAAEEATVAERLAIIAGLERVKATTTVGKYPAAQATIDWIITFFVRDYTPTIEASDLTFKAKLATEVDLLTGVKGFDYEGTELSVLVHAHTVDFNKAGTYTVTYKVTDVNGFSITETKEVTITSNEVPVFTGAAISFEKGFGSIEAAKALISATDFEDGVLNVTIKENNVNFAVVGTYTVIYTTVDTDGNIVEFTQYVSITSNDAPVFTGSNASFERRTASIIDAKAFISVSDFEDETIEIVVVENNVDFSVAGVYTITYSATDTDGNTVYYTQTVTITRPEILVGWEKEDDQWVYYGDENEVHTGWLRENGRTYFLNEDGIMQTGWRRLDGQWYYFYANGAMATGWAFDGKDYYMTNANGEMQTGWHTSGGATYFFNNDGRMATGWTVIEGRWHYFEKSGTMVTGWINLDGWYYLNANGSLRTGWYSENGRDYYLGTNGRMATEWTVINGHWHYFYANGAQGTGWVHDGSDYYYMSNDGKMVTGWMYDGSHWFYMNFSGRMQTGWQFINNTWYYFTASGRMATNTAVGGWVINAGGAARPQ